MEVDGKKDARERFKLRYVIRLVLICALLAGSLVIAQQSVPNADLVVSRPVAHMYKSATADSEVTSQVLYGTGVRSLEKQGDWIRIRTADDYSGWIASGDVDATRGSSRGSGGKLVQVTARSILHRFYFIIQCFKHCFITVIDAAIIFIAIYIV